ncbi:MAG TPA: hypothetical protein PLQ93_08270 [Bacteroidia bacterium]|nr:hypothetical protein [Bacteroidia bacterium]
MPQEYFYALGTQYNLASADSSLHSSFLPLVPGFHAKNSFEPDSQLTLHFNKHLKIHDALFNQHLISIKQQKEKVNLFIDPLINFEIGQDLKDASHEKLFNNTRGIIAGGQVGRNLYFETMVSENQSSFASYLDSFALTSKVIPGQGRWKTFKTNAYDYAFSSGFVAIQAGKHLNIQFGHGKQKIGYGYRSLFLSDNAFNFPFARFSQQWFKGRLQYTNLYTVFMNPQPVLDHPTLGTEALYQKKAGSFQYLSFNPGNRLSLGFFQGLMWAPADGMNRMHLDPGYFNPFIYTNMLRYGLSDNKHNLLAGAELNYKLLPTMNVYAQIAADNLKPAYYKASDGMAAQIGFRCFDVFRIKGLFVQAEFNQSGRAMYRQNIAQYDNPLYYSHYNQNLSSAFVNGKELVFIASYTYRRMAIQAKLNEQHSFQVYTAVPEYRNQFFSGKISYLINPAYNLHLYLSYSSRLQKFNNFSNSTNTMQVLSFGIKTGLYNLYYDF